MLQIKTRPIADINNRSNIYRSGESSQSAFFGFDSKVGVNVNTQY